MKRPLIENWTSDREVTELARLAKDKTVLEVGSYKGFGAVLMANAGATVHAVDWHRGDADLGNIDTLCAWWTNIRRARVEDRVIGHVGRSEDVLPLLKPESFDMAFIDGYHAYEAVKTDIEATLPLMKPGATMAFHDYSETWPGVKKAVQELAKSRNARIQVHDSLAVIHLKE